MLLEKRKKQIAANQLDLKRGREAKEYQNCLIKPKGSLGILESLSIKLAEMTGQVKYNINKKEVILMCGDHGIARYGVSAYGPEVTRQMTLSYLNGLAGANVIARANNTGITVVDIGIEKELECSGLLKRKVKKGTADFTLGPAMTVEEAAKCIEIGIQETEKLIKGGAEIIAPGEMGIGNTTASSALLSVFLDIAPEKVVGRGSYINDEAMKRKLDIVKKGLLVNKPCKEKPIDALAKVGGLEIAGMVGVFIACAANRVPVVVDGFIAGAAALTAKHIAPGCERFMLASHLSQEPGHKYALQDICLKPLLNLEMRLGEATGAIIAMQIIQTAAKVICEMGTFNGSGVNNANKNLEKNDFI